MTPRLPRPRSSWLVVLTAAILAEVMRVSFPLLYDLAGRVGFDRVLWLLPLIFAAPLLAAPLGYVVGARGLLVAGASGLAVARIVLQALPEPQVVVAVAGLALGLVALATALRRSVAHDGAPRASAAIFAGLAIDAAIRLAFVTWDPAWQSTPAAWAVGIGLPAVLVVLVVRVIATDADAGPRARPADAGRADWRLAAVPGALLALQVLFLANPGFVASSGGMSLPGAGVVVLAGLLAALAAPEVSGWNLWIARIWLGVVAAALTGPSGATGLVVAAGVVVGQACVGALVSTAAARAASTVVKPTTPTTPTEPAPVSSPRSSAWRTGLGAGVGSLVLVGVLLPYQISYEIPLGVPQFGFAVVGALTLVALAGSAPAGSAPDVGVASLGEWWHPRAVALAAPLLALAVPFWLAVTWPEPQSPSAPVAGSVDSTVDDPAADEVRVATYNVHSMIDLDGRLDPEGIADVLERGDAEVAMLQEVARGWPLAGGLDGAAWLSRRLGADVAFGPAADHQFGNAVVSTRPLLRFWSATMPAGEGTMQRGYVGARVAVGGSELDAWSTHLQHQDHTTATRQAQAEQLLAAWDGAARTIIGGDLNSRPGSPDIEPWFDGTGLVSAQDKAGDPAWNTSPAERPDHRIDWIFGSPDNTFSDAAIPASRASDHLPVFVTVGVGGADG